MLAKVIAKPALSAMNCLHNYLLLSHHQTHPHSAPLPSMLRLSKLYAARKSLKIPTIESETNLEYRLRQSYNKRNRCSPVRVYPHVFI
jgi:hypothetical protein